MIFTDKAYIRILFYLSGEHFCNGESTYKAPTCTEYGYTYQYCIDCGEEIQYDYIEPDGHQYESLQYDEMYHWYACKWCGDVNGATKETHYGGTATTTEQAKCELCGQAYGELVG